jgi:feruloyl esterase
MRRLLALASFAALLASPAAAITCEGLASLELSNTGIASAQSVAAGAFTPPTSPQGNQNPAAFRGLPAFCRVSATVTPIGGSEIKIEVWMPTSGWNTKFRGTGNGGLGGSLNFNALAAAMRGGYAVAGNSTGTTAARA